jgi:hypothetical protein
MEIGEANGRRRFVADFRCGAQRLAKEQRTTSERQKLPSGSF